MKISLLASVLVLASHFAAAAWAKDFGLEGSSMAINGDGRGGGDLVYCRPQPELSRFAGFYTLDYLLTREDDFNENESEFFRFSNRMRAADSILKEIQARIEAMSPQAGRSFTSFMALVENRDWSVPVEEDQFVRVWEPKSKLLDYKDEDFIRDLPENCNRTDGKLDIFQVVLREDINSNIIYHYNRGLFNQLKASPLQLSYLLVHEWLRDYTVSTASIRRVVQYLHSEEFFSHAPYEAYSTIRRMGVYFDRDASKEPVVQLMGYDTGFGCSGNCGFLDVSIKVKNIQYHKKVSIFYSENGSTQWSELPLQYARPLSHGYEEWVIQQNFSKSGNTIEFAIKYEVGGQIYWDNNRGKNYRGIFRFHTEKP